LKIFLTQTGPTVPLTPYPRIICFWEWIEWKDYKVPKNRNLESVLQKRAFFSPTPSIPACGTRVGPTYSTPRTPRFSKKKTIRAPGVDGLAWSGRWGMGECDARRGGARRGHQWRAAPRARRLEEAGELRAMQEDRWRRVPQRNLTGGGRPSAPLPGSRRRDRRGQPRLGSPSGHRATEAGGRRAGEAGTRTGKHASRRTDECGRDQHLHQLLSPIPRSVAEVPLSLVRPQRRASCTRSPPCPDNHCRFPHPVRATFAFHPASCGHGPVPSTEALRQAMLEGGHKLKQCSHHNPLCLVLDSK
jgi:hypothetical protein